MTTTPLYRPLSLLLLTAALAGCDEPYADRDDSHAEDEDADATFRSSCPKCQFNSTKVNSFPIPSLDLTGTRDAHGVAVRGLRDPDGDFFTLGVLGEELAAYDHGELVASGEKLFSWEIVLDGGGGELVLRIVGHKQQASWAKDGAPVSLYGLVGTIDGKPLDAACPDPEFGASAVTIVHGETYDGVRKALDQVGDQWITLACVDQAAYKVKRLGYGPHGNQGPGGKPASPEQRVATLKMVTADYCGTGQSFTVDDARVYFRNKAASLTFAPIGHLTSVEAYWDAKGALCFDYARNVRRKDILDVCQIPDCKVLADQLPPHWEWKTLLPHQNTFSSKLK